MTRHTADSITDDALDALYARIRTLERVAAGNKRHVQTIVPELEHAQDALDRVRRLCTLTIDASVRRDAIDQARDTLAAIDGPRGEQQPDDLTVAEARHLADDLSRDLYRAQDALAFVAECCDIADREQRPVTTATVREWLKGARCGRQLTADPPNRPERAQSPSPTLRDQIAAAIWERQTPGRRYAECESPWHADAEADADAVLALLLAPTDPTPAEEAAADRTYGNTRYDKENS